MKKLSLLYVFLFPYIIQAQFSTSKSFPEQYKKQNRDAISYIVDGKTDTIIHGYEAGAAGQCKISYSVSELLLKEFNIEKMATGWSGQIREYSIRNNQDWVLSFRELVLKYFYRTQDFYIISKKSFVVP